MHDILTWCVNHNPEKGVPHTIFTVIFCHFIFCRSVHVLAINRWLSRIALVLDCRLLYSTTTAAVKTHQNVFSSPLLTTKVAIAINIVLSNCVDPPEENCFWKQSLDWSWYRIDGYLWRDYSLLVAWWTYVVHLTVPIQSIGQYWKRFMQLPIRKGLVVVHCFNKLKSRIF